MQKQEFLEQFFNELQLRRFALIKIAVITTAFFLCCALDVPAQQVKRTAGKRRQKPAAKNISPTKTGKTIQRNVVFVNAASPVTVINSAETDFLSGEASVAVNPKQPTIVRLGLAQNAVSIIEFPASDGIYYIHEGNPKFASVFQSPTKETDRSITIYPGEGFVAARGGGDTTPSATITLQMRSGLVLILELVPVSDLRQNAHRCVINYKRDEVVAARRAAGLAYDLSGDEVKTNNQLKTRANSKLVGDGNANADETIDTVKNTTETLNPIQTSLEVSKGAIGRKISAGKFRQKQKTSLELSRFVNRSLADCLKNPAKMLGVSSEAKNGLTLAASSVTEIDAEQRLVIVAVSNKSTVNLRLIQDTPELEIQTTDDKGNALVNERLERIYVETTSLEGLILPGSMSFYALVYRAPVLGANQRLRVSVSHREAADSPVVIALPKADTEKE